MITVVRRECRRLERKIFGRRPIEDLAEEQLAVRSDDALRVDLISALESLPPHYLQVVLLRDFAELSLEEIARQIGMEIPGVKSRLHRAREMVRECLISD